MEIDVLWFALMVSLQFSITRAVDKMRVEILNATCFRNGQSQCNQYYLDIFGSRSRRCPRDEPTSNPPFTPYAGLISAGIGSHMTYEKQQRKISDIPMYIIVVRDSDYRTVGISCEVSRHKNAAGIIVNTEDTKQGTKIFRFTMLIQMKCGAISCTGESCEICVSGGVTTLQSTTDTASSINVDRNSPMVSLIPTAKTSTIIKRVNKIRMEILNATCVRNGGTQCNQYHIDIFGSQSQKCPRDEPTSNPPFTPYAGLISAGIGSNMTYEKQQRKISEIPMYIVVVRDSDYRTVGISCEVSRHKNTTGIIVNTEDTKQDRQVLRFTILIQMDCWINSCTGLSCEICAKTEHVSLLQPTSYVHTSEPSLNYRKSEPVKNSYSVTSKLTPLIPTASTTTDTSASFSASRGSNKIRIEILNATCVINGKPQCNQYHLDVFRSRSKRCPRNEPTSILPLLPYAGLISASIGSHMTYEKKDDKISDIPMYIVIVRDSNYRTVGISCEVSRHDNKAGIIVSTKDTNQGARIFRFTMLIQMECGINSCIGLSCETCVTGGVTTPKSTTGRKNAVTVVRNSPNIKAKTGKISQLNFTWNIMTFKSKINNGKPETVTNSMPSFSVTSEITPFNFTGSTTTNTSSNDLSTASKQNLDKNLVIVVCVTVGVIGICIISLGFLCRMLWKEKMKKSSVADRSDKNEICETNTYVGQLFSQDFMYLKNLISQTEV